MNSIISVNDLNLWYGSHQALTNICMEIPEKSITAAPKATLRQPDLILR